MPHRVRGSFINALQDLVPSFSIQAHQVAAAAHPEKHSKKLTSKRKPSRQAVERKVNDRLSSKAL